MGGRNSDVFMFFLNLLWQGINELKKHANVFSSILETMMYQSDLECFENFNLSTFLDRFKENYSDIELENYVELLIS